MPLLSRWLLTFVFLCLACVSAEARGKLQGYATKGSTITVQSGLQSIDKALKVYPSAGITFYIAGTSTLATRYTDTISTVGANPTTADSVGYFYAYLDNGRYDIRIAPVGGVPAPFTLGDFTISDPVEVYNVRNFGALCNGSTEYTVEIQAAATAAQGSSSTGQGVLYYPKQAGECVQAGVVLAGYQEVAGQGVAKLKALTGTTDTALFVVTGTYVTIDSLTLDGNRANQTSVGMTNCACFSNAGAGNGGRAFRALIKADGAANTIDHLIVRNVTMRNSYGAGLAAQDISYVEFVDNRGADINYEVAFLWRSVAAVSTGFNTNAKVTGNVFTNIGFGGVGVSLDTASNAFTVTSYDRFTFTNNNVKSVDGGLIKIESGRNGIISNNSAQDVGRVHSGWPFSISAIVVTSGANVCSYSACGARNIEIGGNTILKSQQGITVQAGLGGVDGVDIHNNIISQLDSPTTADGIFLDGQDPSYVMNNVRAHHNSIALFNRYGIYVAFGTTYIDLDHNHLEGDAATANTRCFQIDSMRAMGNLFITNNDCTRTTNGGSPGIVIFGDTASSITYSNVQITGNVVINSSSSLYALRADLTTAGASSADYVLSGSIADNYFDGAILWRSPLVRFGQQRYVTGAIGVGGASQSLSIVRGAEPLGASRTADFFGATAANTCEDSATTITVNGAVEGEPVTVAAPNSLMSVAGSFITGRVSAADVVTVRRCNVTTSSLSDPGSLTLNVTVNKP